MEFDTISDISFCALYNLIFCVPAWLILYPPRHVRSWPSIYRPLLAFVGAEAGIYALFYGFVYPASRAYHDAHPYSLLHGILMVPPGGAWRLVAPVIIVLSGARTIYFAFIHRYVQRLFSHNRNA